MRYPLIVLSYHRFGELENDYPFSRTFRQFDNDLKRFTFDWITIDDGLRCTIKACEIAQRENIRCKIFINPSSIGKLGYLNWEEVVNLSKYHDIENHGFEHIRLTEIRNPDLLYKQIKYSNDLIAERTGRAPRFFVPPWNRYDDRVEAYCEKYNLILLKNRITIKNDTV